MEDVPIGVTKPQRATLENGSRFAWKPLRPGYSKGFMESYKAEIAAYKLDRMLDMHMVPPIVERKHGRPDRRGGVWVENTKGWSVEKPPQGPEPKWSLQLTRMKMFDLLIANIDRNQGNLIYDADWHLFLIDHSRAFINKKDLKGLAPLGRVDRKLWEKMQALTHRGSRSRPGQVGRRQGQEGAADSPRPDGEGHQGDGRQARREACSTRACFPTARGRHRRRRWHTASVAIIRRRGFCVERRRNLRDLDHAGPSLRLCTPRPGKNERRMQRRSRTILNPRPPLLPDAFTEQIVPASGVEAVDHVNAEIRVRLRWGGARCVAGQDLANAVPLHLSEGPSGDPPRYA